MGAQPENCVSFGSPKSTENSISRDLLKIFEFYTKLLHSQQYVQHIPIKPFFITWVFLPLRPRNFNCYFKKLLQTIELTLKNLNEYEEIQYHIGE